MKTPREILDTIGRERVAQAIGVDMRRVNRAAYAVQLPALWYSAICEMAEQDLPHDLFTFKRAEQEKAAP